MTRAFNVYVRPLLEYASPVSRMEQFVAVCC